MLSKPSTYLKAILAGVGATVAALSVAASGGLDLAEVLKSISAGIALGTATYWTPNAN